MGLHYHPIFTSHSIMSYLPFPIFTKSSFIQNSKISTPVQESVNTKTGKFICPQTSNFTLRFTVFLSTGKDSGITDYSSQSHVARLFQRFQILMNKAYSFRNEDNSTRNQHNSIWNDRFSLWNRSDSKWNIYDSMWQQGNSIWNDSYSLWNGSNSKWNIYDSMQQQGNSIWNKSNSGD